MLRRETDRRIDEWNRVGRRLCLAFLAQAAVVAGEPATVVCDGRLNHSVSELA